MYRNLLFNIFIVNRIIQANKIKRQKHKSPQSFDSLSRRMTGRAGCCITGKIYLKISNSLNIDCNTGIAYCVTVVSGQFPGSSVFYQFCLELISVFCKFCYCQHYHNWISSTYCRAGLT
jgi:hypothetical protein